MPDDIAGLPPLPSGAASKPWTPTATAAPAAPALPPTAPSAVPALPSGRAPQEWRRSMSWSPRGGTHVSMTEVMPPKPPKPTPNEIQAMEQAGVASKGLDDLLATGQKVLPTQPGPAAILNRGQRWLRFQEGYPDVTQFQAAKTVLINHLRAVAGVSRVNQTELMMASEALANAGTYPALVAAVGEAKKRLAASQQEIQTRSAGQMPGAQPQQPMAAPAAAPAAAPTPDSDALERRLLEKYGGR